MKLSDPKSNSVPAALNAPKVTAFQIRTAVDSGHVNFGPFGGEVTAVGIPVIVAARLCDDKGAFKAAGTLLLFGSEFQSGSGLRNFKEVDYEFNPKGVDRKLQIYKHD